MRILTLLAGPATFAGAVLTASCTTTEPRADADLLRPAQRHAIHSQQLRGVMTGLDARARKTWPQEIADQRRTQAERDREIRLHEARELAAALAVAAGQIPEAIEGVELTPAERQAFLDDVGRLRVQARQLESSVAVRDVKRMQSILSSIRATCNHCHEQFRELAGSVDAGELRLAAR